MRFILAEQFEQHGRMIRKESNPAASTTEVRVGPSELPRPELLKISPPWQAIERADHAHWSAIENVGVNHCGFHVGMAEQFLHRADTRIKKRKNDPRAVINKENTLVWPASEGKKDSWVGCQVSVADVAQFKDAWPDLSHPTDMPE